MTPPLLNDDTPIPFRCLNDIRWVPVVRLPMREDRAIKDATTADHPLYGEPYYGSH